MQVPWAKGTRRDPEAPASLARSFCGSFGGVCRRGTRLTVTPAPVPSCLPLFLSAAVSGGIGVMAVTSSAAPRCTLDIGSPPPPSSCPAPGASATRPKIPHRPLRVSPLRGRAAPTAPRGNEGGPSGDRDWPDPPVPHPHGVCKVGQE